MRAFCIQHRNAIARRQDLFHGRNSIQACETKWNSYQFCFRTHSWFLGIYGQSSPGTTHRTFCFRFPSPGTGDFIWFFAKKLQKWILIIQEWRQYQRYIYEVQRFHNPKKSLFGYTWQNQALRKWRCLGGLGLGPARFLFLCQKTDAELKDRKQNAPVACYTVFPKIVSPRGNQKFHQSELSGQLFDTAMPCLGKAVLWCAYWSHAVAVKFTYLSWNAFLSAFLWRKTIVDPWWTDILKIFQFIIPSLLSFQKLPSTKDKHLLGYAGNWPKEEKVCPNWYQPTLRLSRSFLTAQGRLQTFCWWIKSFFVPDSDVPTNRR